MERVLLHLVFITALFFIMNMISKRLPRPVRYLYMFMGDELRTKIVTQQTPSQQDEKAKKSKEKEYTGVLNVPLYASIRRLYKMVVEKGVKLMEALSKEESKPYRFQLYRRRDPRIRRIMSNRKSTSTRSIRGRYVSYGFPRDRPWDVALGPTIRAAAPHQIFRPRRDLALNVEVEDIRTKVRESRAPLSLVLLLDMSESMVPSLANVRNAILSMRDMVINRRDRVGLVVFKGQGATMLQEPTSNINLVVEQLTSLGASDFTPLASGMYEALRVLRNEHNRNKDIVPILVIISDGIANVPLDSPLSHSSRREYLNTSQADVIDVAYLLKREGIITVAINPSHMPVGSVAKKSYRDEIWERIGKRWLEPTELLTEIPRITGGYYYGIGKGGKLEEVLLTEALRVLGHN